MSAVLRNLIRSRLVDQALELLGDLQPIENIDSVDSNGCSVLHLAAGSPDLSQRLIEPLVRCGASLALSDHQGLTPLHRAVYNNNFVATRILLDLGAPVNSPGGVGGRELTPLHTCAYLDHDTLVDVLLEAGADIEQTARKLWTPLHFAANQESRKVAALLIARGASLSPRDEDGKAPIELCAGSPAMVELIKAAAAEREMLGCEVSESARRARSAERLGL